MLESVTGAVLDPTRMMIALAVGIILLVFLVLKTKIHTFLAMILSALFIGIAGGVPYGDVTKSVTDGFGGTLGSIGIIIGFGVMMGAIFEATGAAHTMANVFLKLFGHNREEGALAATGFMVSIPIFCDSGFVILAPLVKALSRLTKKSNIALGVSLAAGLVITHSIVPPTPGPVGVAGIYGISVGTLMLWGIAVSIPMAIVGVFYAKFIGKKVVVPVDEAESIVEEAKDLPPVGISFAPILVPIVLILLNNVLGAMGVESSVASAFFFLGQPIVAVAIGLLIAIFGIAGKYTKEETIDIMEEGIKQAGIIILVTGAGGSLGRVLSDTGLGTYIANVIASTSIPPILIPLLISTLMRFIQGSGTVAMITAASISAPVLASLNVNPVFAALGCCVGSLFFAYFNDSFFNVVTRTLGVRKVKDQVRIWSVTTTLLWGTGVVELLILNALFG